MENSKYDILLRKNHLLSLWFTLKKIYQSLQKFSLKQLLLWLKSRQPTEHLYHSIDHEAFKTLLQYRDNTGHPQYKKYLNAEYWLRKNVKRALYLNLNRSAPQSILDIGCGFGYFPYVSKFYGHSVIGVDLPDDKLFQKASEFLNINRQDLRIEPFTLISPFEQKFDLITAFQVCFNGHIEGEIWGEKEWDFLLNDLFTNHMNPKGKIYLELNWSQHIKDWLPQDAQSLFKKKYNAKFDSKSNVTLSAPGA